MSGGKVLQGIGRFIKLFPTYAASKIVGFNESESCILEGEFKRDQLHGFGRKVWSDSHINIGWFQNNSMHGYAKKVYSNGSISEGLYEEGDY